MQSNHIYTSGATGTNAAVIRGALRAEKPDLLTVVLPQSLSKQPSESQELLLQASAINTSPLFARRPLSNFCTNFYTAVGLSCKTSKLDYPDNAQAHHTTHNAHNTTLNTHHTHTHTHKHTHNTQAQHTRFIL
jgi:hypothetical protein